MKEILDKITAYWTGLPVATQVTYLAIAVAVLAAAWLFK